MNQITYQWQVRWASMLFLTALSVATAQAQSKPEAVSTKEVALPYRSVFDGYQKFSDQPVASWTQTNATVEKIGGWRVYAKEARQPDQPEAPDKAAAVAPSSDMKAGAHGGHGGKP